MADIFLERKFDPALTVDDVLALVEEVGWCFEMHKVQWNGSLLSTDGQSMLCWFSAPDAEAGRVALRLAGADIDVLWTGTVHDAPTSPVPNILVERSFDTPVTVEALQAREDEHSWCLETHQVQFAQTYFSRDRKRMICLYRAPDAESVRAAQREAGMPVDRVWAFQRIGGPEAGAE